MRSISTRWLGRYSVFLLFAIGNNPFNVDTEEKQNNNASAMLQNTGHPNAALEMDQPSQVQVDLDPQLLEFVHIPKTGGSSVEYAGAKGQITWGKCHFDMYIDDIACPPRYQYRQFLQEYLVKTPKENQWAPFWHIPPKFFRNINNRTMLPTRVNPYPVGTPLFAVVRNPYSRLVSEWFFMNQVQLKSEPQEYNNVTTFNIFLTRRLAQLEKSTIWEPQTNMNVKSNAYWVDNAHFIPQSDYIFDDDGTQIVEHVIKFESMKVDFDALMEKYGWGHLKLKEENVNESKNKRLSVPQISSDNFKMINRLYQKDFKNFGYSTHIPEEPIGA